MLGIFVTTFYIGCGTLAWSVLGSLTGEVSLGHAGFMGLGAYIGALLMNNHHITPWVGMIIAFVFVGLLAACLMAPCFVLSGSYFTLVTIAFSEAFRNLFTNWDYAGKGQGILVPLKEQGMYSMRWASKIPYYYIALLMFILFYVILRKIDKSKLGYALKTIREDEETANAVGINPFKYKFIATFISAGLIAVVGVFYANYIGYINPDIMKQSQALNYASYHWWNRKHHRTSFRCNYSDSVVRVPECITFQHCRWIKPGCLCSNCNCSYCFPPNWYHGLVRSQQI